MTTDFTHDPEISRLDTEPAREILVRAHRLMLLDESAMQRYVRQQWEATFAAVRVALESWRKIWPSEARENLPGELHFLAGEIEHALAEVAFNLDQFSPAMQGIFHQAQLGRLSLAELSAIEDTLRGTDDQA